MESYPKDNAASDDLASLISSIESINHRASFKSLNPDISILAFMAPKKIEALSGERLLELSSLKPEEVAYLTDNHRQAFTQLLQQVKSALLTTAQMGADRVAKKQKERSAYNNEEFDAIMRGNEESADKQKAKKKIFENRQAREPEELAKDQKILREKEADIELCLQPLEAFWQANRPPNPQALSSITINDKAFEVPNQLNSTRKDWQYFKEELAEALGIDLSRSETPTAKTTSKIIHFPPQKEITI
jgi:hypothetical protein